MPYRLCFEKSDPSDQFMLDIKCRLWCRNEKINPAGNLCYSFNQASGRKSADIADNPQTNHIHSDLCKLLHSASIQICSIALVLFIDFSVASSSMGSVVSPKILLRLLLNIYIRSRLHVQLPTKYQITIRIPKPCFISNRVDVY